LKRSFICITIAFFALGITGAAAKGQQWQSKRKQLQMRRLSVMHQPGWDLVSAHQPIDAIAALGKLLFEDKNLSLNKNQSCSSCHLQEAKFSDPDNANAPAFRPVSQGSILDRFGGRNAPTAAYAAFSPKLHWNSNDALFMGGVFWDGRASGQPTTATAQGLELGRTEPTNSPLADQAKGPFLNPVEMSLSRLEDVVDYVVNEADYRKIFLNLYGREIYKANKKTIDVAAAYNKIAEAIAAFEKSGAVNSFSSRFDAFVREQKGDVSNFGVVVDGSGFRKYVGPPRGFKSGVFTYEEADGLALFNADSEVQLSGTGNNVGGMCYLCHTTTRHDVNYGANSTQKPNHFSSDGSYPPLFTDFSYDNLGIPINRRIAALSGPQAIDFGLGGADRENELLTLNPSWNIDFEKGKFKVSSLRNIADTAPYGHNGFFSDLYSIVHFYNTRDVAGGDFDSAEFLPEVPETMNKDELGNLGLSFDQEVKIVKFLKTLSDQ
jgi:cytochrome c peroxidase